MPSNRAPNSKKTSHINKRPKTPMQTPCNTTNHTRHCREPQCSFCVVRKNKQTVVQNFYRPQLRLPDSHAAPPSVPQQQPQLLIIARHNNRMQSLSTTTHGKPTTTKPPPTTNPMQHAKLRTALPSLTPYTQSSNQPQQKAKLFP